MEDGELRVCTSNHLPKDPKLGHAGQRLDRARAQARLGSAGHRDRRVNLGNNYLTHKAAFANIGHVNLKKLKKI
jgi:hypothetical protein